MRRKLLEDHLALAERHVQDGERHVAEQRERIALLDLDRHDTAMARDLLARFEDLLALHIADRDRIARELDRKAAGDA